MTESALRQNYPFEGIVSKQITAPYRSGPSGRTSSYRPEYHERRPVVRHSVPARTCRPRPAGSWAGDATRAAIGASPLTRPLGDLDCTLPQDFGERRSSCDMAPSHDRRPRNSGALVGHDSRFEHAEAVVLEFGRKFGSGHVAREAAVMSRGKMGSFMAASSPQ
jgi:hypothetical protein